MKKTFAIIMIVLAIIIAGFLISNFFVDSCAKISDQADRNNCYQDAAIVKHNPKLCEKLEGDKSNKDLCYNLYYRNLAIKTKNILVCDKISEYYDRRRCYLKSIAAITDSNECDKINESDESAIKNDCFQEIAILKQELRICDKIENQVIKNSCYWNIARLKKDISICEKIPDLEDKEWCYHEIAQVNKNSIICDKITSAEAKNQCYECLNETCS